ncbi:hypothetical protein BD408DRAFT_421473, partial [Parasitella parasitica]
YDSHACLFYAASITKACCKEKNTGDKIHTLTSCCFPNPTLYINKKNYKVLSLLGSNNNAKLRS